MRLRTWKRTVCALSVALALGGDALAEDQEIRFTSAEVYVSGAETTQPWATVARRQPEIISPGTMPEIISEPAMAGEYYMDGEPYLFTEDMGVQACGCDACGGSSHGFFDFNFWVAGGATYNSESPTSHFNGPMTFNDRDTAQLNQLYMSLGHDADNGGCGFALGGRVDALYGTDNRFTLANGLDSNWNTDHRFYGVALPQAYMEAAYNDLTVKLGHYYTIIGYEVVTAPGNFFYSHAYTMQYGEPFTHTGALASYAASDTLTLYGGFDRGWDNWEDDNDDMSLLTGIAWDGGCGTTIAYSLTNGDEASLLDSDVQGDRFMYSLVISREVDDRFTYVFQHDLGHQQNGVDEGEDSEWYGINQYFLYEINCCWTAGMRLEWFRDDDGARVTGLQDGNPIQGDRFFGDFYEVSLGLNYRPTDKLLFRPEIRYDWFEGTGTNQPYDDGNKDEQLTASMDVIWRF